MNLTAVDLTLIDILNVAFPLDPTGTSPASLDWPILPWAELARQAEHHEFSGLLFDGLKKLGVLAHVPPETQQALRTVTLRTAHQSMLLDQELAALLAGLDSAGIPVVLLKGPVHARTLYGSAAHRPIGDLDLLVPPTGVAPFVDLLTARGYAAVHRLGAGFEESFSAELCFTRQFAPGLRVNVEPHWHLFTLPDLMQRCPVEWVWTHTRSFEVAGRVVLVLQPGAELLYLSTHLYLQHKGVGLRQSLDLARSMALNGAGIDWQDTAQTAERFGVLPALQAALHDAATRWGAPLPTGAQAILRLDAGAGTDWQIATVQNRYSRHLFDFLHAKSAAERLQYLRGLLFPSHDYLKWRYGMADVRLAPFFYLYRLGLGIVGLPGMLAAVLARRFRQFSR